MLRIILLGAAAVVLAILVDAYASDPNLGQAVPYAALAPIYAPSAVEGRAAYVDHSKPPLWRPHILDSYLQHCYRISIYDPPPLN